MGYDPPGSTLRVDTACRSAVDSEDTVPNEWNGFVAALLTKMGAPSTSTIMQAHGYFPGRPPGSSKRDRSEGAGETAKTSNHWPCFPREVLGPMFTGWGGRVRLPRCCSA